MNNKQAHRICEESIAAGKMLSERVQPVFDYAKAHGAEDPRCKSCAFREGTLPNKCADTVLDATKCMLEGIEFHCHCDMVDGQPTKLCAGWVASRIVLGDTVIETGVPFSEDIANLADKEKS